MNQMISDVWSLGFNSCLPEDCFNELKYVYIMYTPKMGWFQS